jgi:hypothetical protein
MCDSVGLYFERVHPFVPIIHKPRFLEKYAFTRSATRTEDWQDALKSSLLLNCMLALAAGFSKSSLLKPFSVFEKGVPFGKHAANIYYDSLRAPPKSCLEYLQGCIRVLPVPLWSGYGRLASYRNMHATGVRYVP